MPWRTKDKNMDKVRSYQASLFCIIELLRNSGSQSNSNKTRSQVSSYYLSSQKGIQTSTYKIYERTRDWSQKHFQKFYFLRVFLKVVASKDPQVFLCECWICPFACGIQLKIQEGGGKSNVLPTYHACKGKTRGEWVYVHLPEWVMAEFRK